MTREQSYMLAVNRAVYTNLLIRLGVRRLNVYPNVVVG